MKLKIEINLDNAAFDIEHFQVEMYRVLGSIIGKIPKTKEEMETKVFDINGNKVGYAKITE